MDGSTARLARGPSHETTGDLTNLRLLLADATAEANLTWPGVDLDGLAFARHVADRLPCGASLPDDLRNLRLVDLFLACACLRGDVRAVRLFDTMVLSEVPVYVARIERSRDVVDDLTQRLRERMLVGRGLSDYRGRGPLGSWVRVAAIRTALNGKRSDRRVVQGLGRLPIMVSAPTDPELAFLRSRYAAEVKEELDVVLRQLSVDQRNVLRLHYLDDLTIDRIAASYSVHRSTAARWIADARREILARTRRRLRQRFAGTASEVESILGMVRSQLGSALSQAFKHECAVSA